jgi:AcrR family transcriptional regulator
VVRHLIPEKRALFLQTALRLFAAKGVANTSTAEIAKEAGAGAGTLFLYFPTKQALIDALLLMLGRQVADAINAQMDPGFTARQELFAIWKISMQWFLQNPDAFTYIQQVRDSTSVSPEVVAESSAFFAFYYNAIQKGLQEGGIRSYPVDFIGGFLYQGIIATMNYLRMQNVMDNADEIIRMGFTIFWDGIKS